MLFRNLFAAILLASSAGAFSLSRPPIAVPQTRATALNLMSAQEVELIMEEAEKCAHGECQLDEVDSLIASLQDQQSLLSKRIEEMDGLIKELEHINGKDNRPVDEMKETLRAIFRIFALGDKSSGNNYPALSKPMGYSGETAGGGRTAYDVLPPKPMKKAP
mmetsp:Transcript_18383/g.35776  ORF Transcript_18383/g.35776 Transcript_18383/m.35776 type:complete len:162 (-) Transcript_18383:231-716(-)|eukprot:CAMPEP_0171328140 /NCGR_PEP_ID=MMETSP0878-20121228/472_1 /TAXON_ID=67004 /ORGANISM="Thalassiosira weissflogii, Strain CCMP1336" /LENGTH=161 /DNA_ID=CAMNT_0011827969 /DNA_START=141 /DNA_END=626 /DNA_ORIENTATION=-